MIKEERISAIEQKIDGYQRLHAEGIHADIEEVLNFLIEEVGFAGNVSGLAKELRLKRELEQTQKFNRDFKQEEEK